MYDGAAEEKTTCKPPEYVPKGSHSDRRFKTIRNGVYGKRHGKSSRRADAVVLRKDSTEKGIIIPAIGCEKIGPSARSWPHSHALCKLKNLPVFIISTSLGPHPIRPKPILGGTVIIAGAAQNNVLYLYLIHFTNLRDTAACGVEMVTT